MRPPALEQESSEQGSILLPVILLLLLIATAATAMTLQARTSLRDAAVRRDRLTLAAMADGSVRAVAAALATSTASRSAPPFAIDGTPQTCRLADGQQLSLTVQDEGGLVDLNKGGPDLVALVLGRAGLAAPEAATLAATIVAHRADGARRPAPTVKSGQRSKVKQGASSESTTSASQDFILADELADFPGVGAELFNRLRPLFTTANRAAGIDPIVAPPALRSLIPAKELASPAFEPMTTPSNHSDFTIGATVMAPSGQSFSRMALFRLDPESGALGRFQTWDAPLHFSRDQPVEGTFCRRVAVALMPP